jgi:SAM-dependent methyltransferase
VLKILRESGVRRGLVVDLGCGSGRWARELDTCGYEVVGIDRSRAFLDLARRIAPRARLVQGSLWTARIPACDAVTCLGECLNYESRAIDLRRLFARVFAALRPGGVFVFDAAGPERMPRKPERMWTEGRGWAVLVEKASERGRLVRRIVTYRRAGGAYRRGEESHIVRLYRPSELLRKLDSVGFEARQVKSFGRFRLPVGVAGFVALKPVIRT